MTYIVGWLHSKRLNVYFPHFRISAFLLQDWMLIRRILFTEAEHRRCEGNRTSD